LQYQDHEGIPAVAGGNAKLKPVPVAVFSGGTETNTRGCLETNTRGLNLLLTIGTKS
jgi:hypothetical protein